MKKLLLLCACLLALAAPLRAAAAPPEIVVVRILDEGNLVRAMITRGEGKSEKVEFDRGHTERGLMATSEGYYKMVQKLYQEGYTLQSSFTTSIQLGGGYVTLIFTKGQ